MFWFAGKVTECDAEGLNSNPDGRVRMKSSVWFLSNPFLSDSFKENTPTLW